MAYENKYSITESPVFKVALILGTVYFMEWSLGLEPWSGVLEWIFGVEMLERKRNINSGGKICLV